ncbi:hypothetical protein OHB36_30420 [Streptomyces sp. NBC_00320]|uniref:hypothetical protein n=1 Tax=Streptomyces sp. NBC_00320 TaxID=2975711 RepID=UPI00225A1F0F|nr:hypothetical protein [Streptomyces sp. NBC_00320]MCX5151016.1 hypothetical protein [Streptomyces sp. NBC_00320]
MNSVVAESVPSGVKVSWSPVFGARSYTVGYRIAGAANWNRTQVSTNRYDTNWTWWQPWPAADAGESAVPVGVTARGHASRLRAVSV